MGGTRGGGVTRDGGAPTTGGGRHGGRLSRRAALAAALLFCGAVVAVAVVAPACRGLVSDESTPVAVQVVAPPDTIVVGDTVPIEVHALNRSGDTIPGAPLVLVSNHPDTVGVVSGALAVVGLVPGRGDVFARSGTLPSAVFRIVVK